MNRAISSLGSLRAMALAQGCGVALLFMLHRLLLAVSRGHARVVPYALMAQPIGGSVFAAVRDDPATAVRIAPPGDPLEGELPRPPQVNHARWSAGSTCHMATVKGRFAGTIWTRRVGYDEDEVRCEYVLADPATGVWDFDVFVPPRYRIGRTLARMWKAVDADLAAQGVRWSFSRISRFNGASLSAHVRLGAVVVGQAVFVVLGPLQLAFLSRVPFMHVSASNDKRPKVLMCAPRLSPAASVPSPQ